MRVRVMQIVVLLSAAMGGAGAQAHPTGTPGTAPAANATMAQAATRFVEALPVAKRNRAVFDLDSSERQRWHYFPSEMFPRRGIPISALDPPQKARAHALLRSGLSSSGYLAATTIMDLERVLRALRRNASLARDPEEYFITVFGRPDPTGTWGWRVEGHHLSLNFTVVAGRATAGTPSFFGADPATQRTGDHVGRRALGRLDDAGWALVRTLTAAQRKQALLPGGVPDDIVSGAGARAGRPPPAGIDWRALTLTQQALLESLLTTYTSMMADDVATARWSRVRAGGMSSIRFAWAGSIAPGEPHYYRVQGREFLVELDNTQGGGNHIHSVWRDFEGDFGRDPIREHLTQVKH